LFARGGNESAKIIQASKFRMNCGMAPFSRANRINAARIAFRSGESVVAALPVCLTYWMNGRKIHHVEAKISDIRKICDDVPERAVAMRRVRDRARKEFVPG